MNERRSGGRLALLVAGLVYLSPLLTLIVIHRYRSTPPFESRSIDHAATFVPEQRSSDSARVVTAVITWEPGFDIVAPAMTGVITEVSVAPGDEVEPLDVVLQVDGIDRIAWHGRRPFHRDLALGSTGDDVASLQELLLATGALDEDTSTAGRFDRATRSAVTELGFALGYTGARTTFEASWVVHLPTPKFEIAEVNVRPALPAPPAGSPLARSSPDPASVELYDGSNLDEVLTFTDGYILVFGGQQFAIRDGVIDDTDDLRRLGRVVGPPDGAEDTSSFQATVRLQDPVNLTLVPAQSVSVGADGVTCIWVADPEPRPLPIVVTDARVGPGLVALDTAPGAPVLITPEAAGHRGCDLQ